MARYCGDHYRSTGICGLYALKQPSVYKAEALLLPLKAKDVQSLNVQGEQGEQGVRWECLWPELLMPLKIISLTQSAEEVH